MDVALALLRRGPAVARQPVAANGYMPLHLICEHQRGEAGLEFLEALLATAPEVADIPTTAGYHAIHIAAKFQNRPSGPAFVRRLLAAAPQSLLRKTPSGSTVLHLVAEGSGGRAAAEIVQSFAKQASASGASLANVSDGDGLVPLHKAVISEGVGKDDAAVVRALLTSWPDAAAATTHTGWTPLHLFAENVADAAAAKTLVQLLLTGGGAETAIAVTARSVTSDGLWTPLHIAVSNRHYETAIALLQHGGPAAARMPSSCGRLPLHIFALKPVLDTTSIVTEGTLRSGPAGVLACLAEAHPAAFVTEDDYGWLPLHLAAQTQKNEAFFQEFIKAAKHTLLRPVLKPQISFCTALKQPHKQEAELALLGDRTGLLPIHAAAMGYREPPPNGTNSPARWGWGMAATPAAVRHRNPVEILLEFDKGMARAAVGSFLLTPMHIAAFYGATPEAKALHAADAEVVTMRTKNGHLPLHLAAPGQHPDMFIEVLLMWPEAIDQVSTDGRTPLSYITSEYTAGRVLAAAQETIAPRIHMMTGLTEEVRRRITAAPGAAALPPGLQFVDGADNRLWL
jgi:ankyrin repeat protein